LETPGLLRREKVAYRTNAGIPKRTDGEASIDNAEVKQLGVGEQVSSGRKERLRED